MHGDNFYFLHYGTSLIVSIQTSGNFIWIHSPLSLTIQVNDQHPSVAGIELGDELVPTKRESEVTNKMQW